MKKIILILLAALLTVSSASYSVFASEAEDVPLLEKIPLPDGLNFQVNDSCSEHAYFMQAAANDRGGFAVYSMHVNYKNGLDHDFEKAYIDIYNPDGSFSQEISFFTPFDFSFSLESSCVKMYFYDYVLLYDLDTRELTSYSTYAGLARTSDFYYELRKSRFSAGDWTYECKRGFNGYEKLIRTSNNERQIIVEMHGSGPLIRQVILPGGICGLVGFVACIIIFRKRKQMLLIL